MPSSALDKSTNVSSKSLVTISLGGRLEYSSPTEGLDPYIEGRVEYLL